ncbi:hypothetical protein BS78_08G134900 [Paspalum vaginatum]|nr:hypothetical protein BS78_08G134900 [Paspalum vaginatum]
MPSPPLHARTSSPHLPCSSAAVSDSQRRHAIAMAPSTSDVAIVAAINGDTRLLKSKRPPFLQNLLTREMARKTDLREAKGPRGWNLLHFAATGGRREVCKFLVEQSGLDVNGTNDYGFTPMALAAAEGKVSILVYLLDHGGDPAVPDAAGSTPRHCEAEHGHCEAVRLLLSKGVDVDTLHPRRGSPRHIAAVKVLLEHGVDPNRVVYHILSPLITASCSRSIKCMKLLVEAGADLNFRKPYRLTALMHAVVESSTDIVKFLLEAGADPNISDEVSTEFPLPFVFLLIFGDNATLFANRSLCWLRMGDAEPALLDARHCKMLRPRWSKAWYREGAALSMLKDYEGAVDVFTEALKLEPANEEIKKALRDATDALRNGGRSGEQNP